MTKYFKNLRTAKKTAAPVPPRVMEEIQAEYSQLVGKAGQNQYQAYVLEQERNNLNSALIRVNQEAAARQQLDQQTAKETPVTNE